MIKHAILLLAALAAASTFAVSATAANDMKVGPAGVSVTVAPFDQQFIDMMAAHHQMAIEMAKMVDMHSTHADVKALARGIVAAQSREIQEFHALRKRWYGNAAFRNYGGNELMMRSMGMSASDMAGMMRAPRFDYAFLSSMIPHHAGAITMARWEEQAGTHAALRKIAAGIIRDQAKEIGQMINWRVSWYGG
jgi:uncharacterized protein (DUF305 family)